MKTSSKLTVVAFTVAALCFTTHVKAQTTSANALRLGIGVDAGIPTGNLANFSNFILGGTARLQYGLCDKFALTLASGADHFFSKTQYSSFGIIPIQAGGKIFFAQSLYFGAEAGVAFEQTDSGDGSTKFLLAPALGWANEHWDLSVRYDNLSGQNNPYGFVALRIAYGFKL